MEIAIYCIGAENNMEQIFTKYVETPNLSVDQERELLRQAQTGDDQAFETLLLAYSPVLKKVYASAPKAADRGEVRSVLLLGFTEAVYKFDPVKHETLSYVVKQYLNHEMSRLSRDALPVSIPPRTLTRFFQVLRQADGDFETGVAIASEFGMSTDTFTSVYGYMRDTDSLDNILSGPASNVDGLASTTDTTYHQDNSILTNSVFAELGDSNDLDDKERNALTLYYDGSTDSHVGTQLGCSRQTAQRIRQTALEKARRRLGVA